MQSVQLKEQLKKEAHEIKSTVVHPDIGIYRGGGTSYPKKLGKPKVCLDDARNLMVVEWSDYINSKSEVFRYEIRYNDAK